MSDLALVVPVVDEDAQESERLGVKNQDLTTEEGRRECIWQVGDIEQAVRTDDDAPWVKVDREPTGRVKLPEELAGLGVVGEEPAGGRLSFGSSKVVISEAITTPFERAMPAGVNGESGAGGESLLDGTNAPSERPLESL
jgi:hypothetical protein